MPSLSEVVGCGWGKIQIQGLKLDAAIFDRIEFCSEPILSSTLMDSELASVTRERDLDDTEDARPQKRTRIDDSLADDENDEALETTAPPQAENLLPPSHVLLGTTKPSLPSDGSIYKVLETDVGISEYISCDVPEISGIIKQRCVHFCSSTSHIQ